LRRRPGLTVLAAALAVLVVGGGIGAYAATRSATPPARSSSAATTSADPAPSTSPTQAARIPDGYQAVTYRGLTVDVPATWPINAAACGTPLRDTVLMVGGGGAAQCALVRPAGVSWVQFVAAGQLTGPGLINTDEQATTVMIDGLRAVRTTGEAAYPGARDPILHVIAISVPELIASIMIMSPSALLADSIAATVTANAQDPDDNGCLLASTAASALPTGQPQSRPGAADQLIPGAPTDIAVCRYYRSLIAQSVRLDPSQRATFIATLNALPEGLSRTPTANYMPGGCRPANAEPGSFTLTDGPDSDAYLVHVRYVSGPDVTVVARLGLCGDLGASNGSRTGQRTWDLVELLSSVAGAGTSVPQLVLPA